MTSRKAEEKQAAYGKQIDYRLLEQTPNYQSRQLETDVYSQEQIRLRSERAQELEKKKAEEGEEESR